MKDRIKKILLILTIFILLIFSSLLINFYDNDRENNNGTNDTNYVIIHVNFKPNTTLTYISYIKDKYNFTKSVGSLNSTGKINRCGFFINEQIANEIGEKLEKEEKIDYINTYNYRIIEIAFKPNTNVTYISYIENKYDIIPGASSKHPDGSLYSCDYFINEQIVNEIFEKMEDEEIVNYVQFADIEG